MKSIKAVFDEALKTKYHQPGDWRQLTRAQQLEHLHKHYWGFMTNASDDNHLRNLICRCLFLLQLDIEASVQKPSPKYRKKR